MTEMENALCEQNKALVELGEDNIGLRDRVNVLEEYITRLEMDLEQANDNMRYWQRAASKAEAIVSEMEEVK
jgi:hypothetical protein